MRKVVVSTYVSLDGLFDDPGGLSEAHFSDEAQSYQGEQLWASDALLLGRKTYEIFAAAWPNMEEQEGDFAVRMNSLPKFVASTTLTEPLEWNATLIEGDVPESVARLKEQPGQDILVFASGALMHTLMRHDLIDEYRIWIFPVVQGQGRRLFEQDGIDKTTLRHVDTRTFDTGIVLLAYEPAR